MLQRRIMQALTDPAGHAHDQPVEIRAAANAPEKIITLRVQFPEEFQKVLAVCHRPNQLMRRSLESKRQLVA